MHYSDIRTDDWRWKNFTAKELSCKHCGEYYHYPEFLDKLQELRELWGKPIVLTSAHRCKIHNKNVGGAPLSGHLSMATDCVVLAEEQSKFIEIAKSVGFTGIGNDPRRNFVHIDLGKKRCWTYNSHGKVVSA